MKQFLVITLALSLFAPFLNADEWAQFRGADGSGVSPEKNLPVQWSKDKGIVWKVDLPGQANSCPAVTANRVDVTSKDKDDSLWILSYSAKDGKLIRKIRVGKGKLAATGEAKLYAHRHNAATPTPIADSDHVWAFFGSGLLVCVKVSSGEILWKKDMNKEYGPYDIAFGMGSSPRLWNDLLIVNCMTKGPSYVVAFNKNTGKQVWFVKRMIASMFDGPDAYTTPAIAKLDGKEVLLISGSDHVTAHDPKTGKQLWISAGLSIDSHYGRVIASVTASDNVVVATSANPGNGTLGRMIAFKGTGKGDITKSNRLWSYAKSTPDSSTPICYKGRVYLCSDKGIGTCLDLKSGEVKWRKRIGSGPFHASLVAGDDKVYFLGIDGTCVVIKADDKGTVLSTNKLTDGNFYATPAIANGRIYLRSYDRLYAIGSE